MDGTSATQSSETATVASIADLVRQAKPGQKFELTFRLEDSKPPKFNLSDGMKAAVSYLLGMHGENLLFPDFIKMNLWSVANSGYWSSDSYRKVKVEIPEGFDPDWFLDRLENYLEKVQVIA
jgi:hypothetical protein